ncbi:MAG: hypothetical protein HKN09_04600, partial [Saprospiraceae bacterium]|nr:hypothetical protein [Saprospiraceae bacterium]
MKRYHYRGTQDNEFKLFESDDLVIVRTKENWNPQEWLSVQAADVEIDHVKEVDVYPEASVYVFKLLHDISARTRDQFKESIKNLDDKRIVFIGTVFINEFGSYQIYTGNLFLKFQNHVDESVQRSILGAHNLKEKRKLKFSQCAYFLEPEEDTGRDIFELSTDLLSLPEVELCHPELVVARKTIEYRDSGLPEEQEADWALRQVKLFDAWKKTKG